MPVETDPGATTVLSIRSAFLQRDVAFKVRVPNRKMRKQNEQLLEDAKKLTDRDAFWDRVKEGIEFGVVGWKEPEPFTFDAIEEKLDNLEILDLLKSWPYASLLTEDDKGKSSSPPVATNA